MGQGLNISKKLEICPKIRFANSIHSQIADLNPPASMEAIQSNLIWAQLGGVPRKLIENLERQQHRGLLARQKGGIILIKEGRALMKQFRSQGSSAPCR